MSLNPHLFAKNVERIPTRDGFGEGLVLAGARDERVVALTADLSESTRTHHFAERFPERFFEVGVAEQNMVTVAAGLAAGGKIPFTSSYATFSPGRNWEQIRTTIAYNDQPVKLVGCHAGLSVGPDGATHQALEDIALMRVLPGMTVLVPCDAIEARKATLAAADHPGPVYLRVAREATPVITTERSPFRIGHALELADGADVTLIACGPLLAEALKAARTLRRTGITARVLNCPSIKPLDEAAILRAARETGAIVSVEEHQIAGGLGGAVAELLARTIPTPQAFVGMPNQFGESGGADELLGHFHLLAPDIVDAARAVVGRKPASARPRSRRSHTRTRQ